MQFLFAILCFALTAALLRAGRLLALKIGFVDRPGGRKTHTDLVPPIGGLAVVPVFLLCAFISGVASSIPAEVIGGALVLLVLGAVDDRYHIRASFKYLVQFLVAGVVVIHGGVQIENLGDLFALGPMPLGEWMAPGFTIVCLVLLMNALNMIDGLDGLAGGLCAIILLWLMLVAGLAGAAEYVAIMGLLLSALIGFLAFNLRYPGHKKASVFLGDSGALALGLLLGWLCVDLSQNPPVELPPASVAWMVALPVMDVFALVFVRLKSGRHPFDPDRNHFHHQLADSGMAPGRAVTLILALSSVAAAVGFAGYYFALEAWVIFYAWVAVLALHTAVLLSPQGYRRFFG